MECRLVTWRNSLSKRVECMCLLAMDIFRFTRAVVTRQFTDIKKLHRMPWYVTTQILSWVSDVFLILATILTVEKPIIKKQTYKNQTHPPVALEAWIPWFGRVPSSLFYTLHHWLVLHARGCRVFISLNPAGLRKSGTWQVEGVVDSSGHDIQ